MIKANELRIGNLVHLINREYSEGDWVDESDVIEIKNISSDGINDEVCGDYYGGWQHDYDGHFYEWGSMNKVVYGIPLTEEWLRKFGFEKDSFGNMSINIWSLYEYNKNGWWFNVRDRTDNSLTGFTQIKHVHQLQNIFFALTGTEITI